MTIVGSLGVNDLGGRVIRTDETRQLALFRLIRSLGAGLANFVNHVKESADRAVNATGKVLGQLALHRDTASWTTELGPAGIPFKLDINNVEESASCVIDVEVTR